MGYTRAVAVAPTADQLSRARSILVTPHFHLAEFYIHELPPDDVLRDKLHIMAGIAEWYRTDIIRGPVTVKSYFRSADHNAAVGGATASPHMQGDALDLVADPFVAFDDIAGRVLAAVAYGSARSFGQIILYADQGHIHITAPGTPNDDQMLLLASPDKAEDAPRSYVMFDTLAAFRRILGSSGGATSVGLLLFFFVCSQLC